MIACWFFCGVLFCVNLLSYIIFVFFLLLFWLCPFLKNQIVWFGFQNQTFFMVSESSKE